MAEAKMTDYPILLIRCHRCPSKCRGDGLGRYVVLEYHHFADCRTVQRNLLSMDIGYRERPFRRRFVVGLAEYQLNSYQQSNV